MGLAAMLAASCCALLLTAGCSNTLKPTDPSSLPASGNEANPVAQSAKAHTTSNSAVSPLTAPPAASPPAASETEAPAVSSSYIKAGAAASTASVYIQGDSLTVPIESLLRRLLPHDTLTISAKIGRPLYVGLDLLKKRARTPGLPQVIVMEMGSNDDYDQPSSFSSKIAQTMSVIGDQRCTIWVNLYQRVVKGKGKSRHAVNIYSGLNQVIGRAAARYKRFVVVPWATTAGRHLGWFGSDGVHPNDAGSTVFAQMIAAAVKTCKDGGLPPLNSGGGGASPSSF